MNHLKFLVIWLNSVLSDGKCCKLAAANARCLYKVRMTFTAQFQMVELSTAAAVLDQSINISALLLMSIFKMYTQIENNNTKTLKCFWKHWYFWIFRPCLQQSYSFWSGFIRKWEITYCHMYFRLSYTVYSKPGHVKQIKVRSRVLSIHSRCSFRGSQHYLTCPSPTWHEYFVNSEKAGFWLIKLIHQPAQKASCQLHKLSHHVKTVS